MSVNTLYKTVDRKVRPAASELPESAWRRVQAARQEPRWRPPESIGHVFTPDTLSQIQIGNPDEANLLPIEREAFQRMIGRRGKSFAFGKEEIGCVDPRVVPPMVIFTVEHVPWNLKPIQVPRAYFDKLLTLLQDWLKERVLEPCAGPYASRWFTVPKKNGELRFIQDLQPANRVTICNAGIGPLLEEYVEEFAGRVIYSMGDLFRIDDQFQLELASHDLTAIMTPLGYVCAWFQWAELTVSAI